MKRASYYFLLTGLSAVMALSPYVHVCAAQVPAAEDAAAEGTAADKPGEEEAPDRWGSDSGRGDSVPGMILEKSQEALQNVDKTSVRRRIRETLTVMDEMGITPSAIAENVLGLQTDPARNVETFGSELMKEAQKEVEKRSSGFLSTIWEGFLDTLGSIFSGALSMFDLDSILHRQG